MLGRTDPQAIEQLQKMESNLEKKKEELLHHESRLSEESRRLLRQRDELQREREIMSVERRRVEEMRNGLALQVHYLLDAIADSGRPAAPLPRDEISQQRLARRVGMLMQEFKAATYFTRQMYAKSGNDPQRITEIALRIGCGIGRLFRAQKSQERRFKLAFIQE